MSNDNRPIMVTIRCLAYNQENYIRQCLNGFVMQKTNFRFEAIVHDDASTDGTADIIREYAGKYPDIIKPIIEKENLYSRHDGSLAKEMDKHMRGKYIALCEGDDFWTDSLKLQKQYDFMEAHPECSLCFHADNRLLPSGEQKIHRPKTIKEFYTTEDIILGGGGFMATNSMFYRQDLFPKGERPDFWKNSPVGDMPLMLYFATKGNIGFIDETMSSYRVNALGSWSTRQNSFIKRKKHHYAILRMFDKYDLYTNYRFHKTIVIKKGVNKKKYYNIIIKNIIDSITKHIHNN